MSHYHSQDMMNTPRATFLEDFKEICSNSKDKDAVESQQQKRNEYKQWFDAPIHEKVLYLDRFNDEQKKVLQTLNPLFYKWINSAKMITSVKIQSEPAEVKQILQNNKSHSYLKYSAEFGTVVFEPSEMRKKYQVHNFDFWKTTRGTYWYKRNVKDVPVKFDEPISEQLIDVGREPPKKMHEYSDLVDSTLTEYIHSTARVITEFINGMDNFADDLNVDVKLWSQRYTLKKKFHYVRKLRVVHNSPSSTHWWMSHVDTLRTIGEVTVSKNHSGAQVAEKESETNEKGMENKNLNFEPIPYTLPLKKRETPVWVNVLPYCEHPILWARKLTIETNVENPMTDLSEMSSLTEIDMYRSKLDENDLTDFLRMWVRGQMGHRLERVTIRTSSDMKLDNDIAFTGGYIFSLTTLLNNKDSTFSDDFRSAVTMNGADVYYVRRYFSAKKSGRIHKVSVASVSSSSDSAFGSQYSLHDQVNDHKRHGAFALVHVTKNAIHFTVVRNSILKELQNFDLQEH